MRLDHLILRSPKPADTLAALENLGLPVLEPVQPTAGGAMHSGIARAGSLDVEVLGVGAEPGPQVEGYGVGLVAPGQELKAVAAWLREQGLATSGVVEGRAGSGDEERRWRVIQIAGLLPEPFPVPFTTRPPGRLERLAEPVLGFLGQVPPIARAATRKAGRSMVAVTSYDFDVEAWRATVPAGPAVVEVEIGVGDALSRWEILGHVEGPRLVLDPGGPTGIRRVSLRGEGWPAERDPVTLGDVMFCAAG